MDELLNIDGEVIGTDLEINPIPNLYHCDFCKKVSDCEFHYITKGTPCALFELIDLRGR